MSSYDRYTFYGGHGVPAFWTGLHYDLTWLLCSVFFSFLSSPSLSILCHVRYVYAIMYFFVFCHVLMIYFMFIFSSYHICMQSISFFPSLSLPFPTLSTLYIQYFPGHWINYLFIVLLYFICCILYSKLWVGVRYYLPRQGYTHHFLSC